MVPILKNLLFLLFLLTLISSVQSLDCTNFDNPNTENICKSTQSLNETKQLILLSGLSSQNTIQLAEDYNKDISNDYFRKYSESHSSRFIDEAYVYIRTPFRSVYGEEVYPQSSGSYKVVKGFSPGIKKDVWKSFSEEYCSNYFKVRDYRSSLNNFVNGEEKSENNFITYNVDNKLNLRTVYRIEVELVILERDIVEKEDSVDCVDNEKYVKSENFVVRDHRDFDLIDHGSSNTFFRANDGSIVFEHLKSQGFRNLTITGQDSRITVSRDYPELEIKDGVLMPVVQNEYSVNEMGFQNKVHGLKEDSNHISFEINDWNPSYCQIKLYSVSNLMNQSQCNFEDFQEYNFSLDVVDRYSIQDDRFVNISLNLSGRGESSAFNLEFNDFERRVSINNSHTYLSLPLDSSGFLYLKGLGVSSESGAYFISYRRPIVLASRILVIIFSCSIFVWVFRWKVPLYKTS